MEFTDTYLDIKSLYQSMNNGFDLELWKRYINKILSGLSEKIINDSENYDFNSEILPVLQKAICESDKLEAAHNSFLKATKSLNEKILNAVGIELDVDIIFYLGLCNGAGWATKLNDKRIILLGAEKIIELNWHDIDSMIGLIYHELGHIWHDTAGQLYQDTSSIREKYVLQLYQEGIAMYFEQLVSNDFAHYHQNKSNWLDWCARNKQGLNAKYARRLQENESAQDFFGDWCNYQGYSDVGYYIGCEFIKHLAKKYSLKELANLSINVVYGEFLAYAG